MCLIAARKTNHSSKLVSSVGVFFFFQAEDGIRDWSVTGVQTCALPISSEQLALGFGNKSIPGSHEHVDGRDIFRAQSHGRSEERRVGKECRSRWSPYH